MWVRAPKYTVKINVPDIKHHDHLPLGATELARLDDRGSQDGELWIFVENNGFLSILNVTSKILINGSPFYVCGQNDFPLGFLAWFPALHCGIFNDRQLLVVYRRVP